MKLEEDELKILRSLLGRIDNSDLADLLGMDRFGGVVGTAADRAEPYKPPEAWTLLAPWRDYESYLCGQARKNMADNGSGDLSRIGQSLAWVPRSPGFCSSS